MIEIDGHSLTIEQIVRVAREGEAMAPLAEDVSAAMQRSYEWLDRVIERDERTIYGVNTGFGPLATRRIRPSEARRLSRNVALNCAAGVGESLPREVVRAMMLIRANSLAKGLSGVRPQIAETLLEMLNRDVTPEVPAKGSLGASGDLAPQAHIAVVLLDEPDGEGDEGDRGEVYSGFARHEGGEHVGPSEVGTAHGYSKAGMPVRACPMISMWISLVPS